MVEEEAVTATTVAVGGGAFTLLLEDIVLSIVVKLDGDPRDWARVACVSAHFALLAHNVCCLSKCFLATPYLIADLLPSTSSASASSSRLGAGGEYVGALRLARPRRLLSLQVLPGRPLPHRRSPPLRLLRLCLLLLTTGRGWHACQRTSPHSFATSATSPSASSSPPHSSPISSPPPPPPPPPPRDWVRVACVSASFASLVRDVCYRSKCFLASLFLVADLLPFASSTSASSSSTASPLGSWAALHKLSVCYPSSCIVEKIQGLMEKVLGCLGGEDLK